MMQTRHTQAFHLDAEEALVLKFRKHWFVLVRDSLPTALAAFLPPLVFAAASALGLAQAVYVPASLLTFTNLAWFLVVWCTLSLIWTNYYLDLWMITDKRVVSIDQVGLFHREVTTLPFANVQDVTVEKKGIIQTLLNFGTVRVQTAAPTVKNMSVEGIPRPEDLRDVILKELGEYKDLAVANRRQEELLHTISHEVKGHLTKSQAALASIAEGDWDAKPGSLHSMAETALSETRRGVSTVMDILDSSNFKRGTMALANEPFDMKSMVLDLTHELKNTAQERGLTLQTEAGNGDFRCVGDESKLRNEVVRNLIDNAIRYTKQGSVQVALSSTKSAVRLEVADTGVGITPEDMRTLFTEGGKGKNSRDVNPESTGYGLFIAKQIVNAHGGNIWAESEGAGKGARFFVELPRE